jgi:phage/plasmid-like protein (TIGR03299 family)
MSHELEILEDGTASMFSGENLTPWHGLGTVVEGVVTAEEALKLAHLDWSVEKQPIYLGSGTVIPDRHAIVRDRDQKPLGVVGSDYVTFQNVEAFSFFDTVTDKGGEAHYTAAGSLFGGKRIFLTAKVGDTITVAGDDDHDLYLLLTTSHDGSRAFTAATTMIRAGA